MDRVLLVKHLKRPHLCVQPVAAGAWGGAGPVPAGAWGGAGPVPVCLWGRGAVEQWGL